MRSSSPLPSAIAVRKSAVTKSILRWYKIHQRNLPWRKTHHPYRILVSEIMLQQTQVSRVLVKYPEFLKRFPNFAALAASTPAEAIRAWQGMGYNNRVLRLRQIAAIVTQQQHRLPGNLEGLRQLPGIGHYTAHAVLCFAFQQPVPVVDTNIRRVLRRIYGSAVCRMDDWLLAELSLPRRSAYNWNQALMDIGATICTASSPNCAQCPVRRQCLSAFTIQSAAKKKRSDRKIPDRIYRGKIIELLRQASDHHPVELSRIGKAVKHNFQKSDMPWLQSIAGKLQREGLASITMMHKKIFLSLPQ